MKSKRILVWVAIFGLAVLGMGLLAYHFLPLQAPAAAGTDDSSASVEMIPEMDFSLEDQGYVDCPEELDENPTSEPVQQPQGDYCLADLLPWGHAPRPFHAGSSLETLQASCGAVFADFLFYRGEGQCQWGTAMFHGTSREIQIAWKNWKEKKIPGVLRFVGSDLHFENGLRPGMLLKDVATLNGKAITLSGFGWDGSGFHRSFQGGSLQTFDSPESPYLIHYTLDWDLFDSASEEEHASIIVGQSQLESTIPALEKFKAQVEYVEYRWSSRETVIGQP